MPDESDSKVEKTGSEEPAIETADETPRPWWVRAGLVAGGIAVVALMMLGSAHMMTPAINPRQPEPAGHYGSACWLCHFTNENAKIQTLK